MTSPSATDSATSHPFISRQLKQGIKTGLAGVIAYALYAGFHLPEGYWAVFSALIVTQANLGASWKSALYRTIGTTAGAVSAAVLAALIGAGPVRMGILLFLLASFFGYLTTRHPSFSVAGYTVALVLFFSHPHEYWRLAWDRTLYTVIGAVIAFMVSVVVWPVRARESLKGKIALLLDDCARLTSLMTESVLHSQAKEAELEELSHRILHHRRAVTQGLEEARSEPARWRFDHDAYTAFVEELDHIRVRLLSMSADTELYAEAGIQADLVPSLTQLCQRISDALSAMASGATAGGRPIDLTPLNDTVAKVDAELNALRQARTTAPFTLDRMLPFWSFVFNLKEIAAGVGILQRKLPELS